MTQDEKQLFIRSDLNDARFALKRARKHRAQCQREVETQVARIAMLKRLAYTDGLEPS